MLSYQYLSSLSLPNSYDELLLMRTLLIRMGCKTLLLQPSIKH
jgi:hypothetical protein